MLFQSKRLKSNFKSEYFKYSDLQLFLCWIKLNIWGPSWLWFSPKGFTFRCLSNVYWKFHLNLSNESWDTLLTDRHGRYCPSSSFVSCFFLSRCCWWFCFTTLCFWSMITDYLNVYFLLFFKIFFLLPSIFFPSPHFKPVTADGCLPWDEVFPSVSTGLLKRELLICI